MTQPIKKEINIFNVREEKLSPDQKLLNKVFTRMIDGIIETAEKIEELEKTPNTRSS